MELGGPVWHASGKGRSYGESRAIAATALLGVGDTSLGEWWEKGTYPIVHLRRRLSAEEQTLVGDVRDIRGSEEERQRYAALYDAVPHLRGYVA